MFALVFLRKKSFVYARFWRKFAPAGRNAPIESVAGITLRALAWASHGKTCTSAATPVAPL
jgi:hypothetical protein